MKVENENKRLVAELYEKAWGRGDLAVIDEVFAPTHVLHWNDLLPSAQERTSAEVKAIVKAYREAFPDLVVRVEAMVAEGDRVVVQVSFVGTHEKAYEGYPPTNKKSSFTDIQILRFAEGKIVESSLGSGGLRYFFSILDGSIFLE
jgi:steroid delta-isomerase-like uncharacterized protein